MISKSTIICPKMPQIISLLLLCNLILSCASKELFGDLVSLPLNTKYEFDFDFSHPEKVREQIKKLGRLDSPSSQQRLVRILTAFTNLNLNIEGSEIKLLSNSKTHIKLNSFCASSSRAMPEKKEVFRWVKGRPDIQLIREVITLFNKRPSMGKFQIQELVWNLENKTYFEDYPANLKQILLQASPNAKLILPSYIKSKIANEVMPEKLKEVFDIVEGQYHTFEDFKKRIDSIKSKSILSQNNLASTLPSSPVLANTNSDGYDIQTITLYNPTYKDQSLKISDYYLKPLRSDVQPIILASALPYNDEIKKILEDAALKMLGYIGSQYPTLNATEKDLVKKRPIDSAIVFYNAMTAEKGAEKNYPNSAENGKSDAFRHYVWAGLLTRDLGETTAREFLSAHELNPKQPVIEKEMDMFNNAQGIRSAHRLLEQRSFTDQELFNAAISEIKSGNLKVLNFDDKRKRY